MRKWLIVALLLAALPSWADVKLGERKAVEGVTGAVDVAVTPDGRRIFVLTDQGEIRVIGANGKLEGAVKVGAGATRIESLGRGERMVVVTKEGKVEVLRLDFQVEIDVGASPVKGDPKAPVMVAVFTDFQ